MKVRSALRVSVVGCLLPLLLSGCTTPVEGLYQNPSFTYPAVTTGGVGVGGVVSVMEPLSRAERSRYANLMHGTFRDRCEGYRVVSSGMLANQVGLEEHHALLDEYRDFGMLSDARLQDLSDKTDGVRYVAFARIDSDIVRQQRSSANKYDSDGKELPGQEITLKTVREVSVFMSIYDLEQGVTAWSGSVSKTTTRDTSYTEREYDKTAVAIMDAIFGEEPEHPEPATLGEVLESVFRGFAENMPEPES